MTDLIRFLKYWNMISIQKLFMHAKTSPNIADKDEFTLAQAEKPELKFEWPSWWEALKRNLRL